MLAYKGRYIRHQGEQTEARVGLGREMEYIQNFSIIHRTFVLRIYIPISRDYPMESESERVVLTVSDVTSCTFNCELGYTISFWS